MTRILTNGDLLLTADNRSRAWLADAFARGGYDCMESALAEMMQEAYQLIRPECIGALTNSPILCKYDDCDFSDEAMSGEFGGPLPYPEASVYWFPDYAVRDPWEELKNKGRVIFTLAPK